MKVCNSFDIVHCVLILYYDGYINDFFPKKCDDSDTDMQIILLFPVLHFLLNICVIVPATLLVPHHITILEFNNWIDKYSFMNNTIKYYADNEKK